MAERYVPQQPESQGPRPKGSDVVVRDVEKMTDEQLMQAVLSSGHTHKDPDNGNRPGVVVVGGTK